MLLPVTNPEVENGEKKGRSKSCGGDRVEQLEQEEEPARIDMERIAWCIVNILT